MFYSIFLSTILAIQFCFSIQLLKSFVLRANEETKFSLLCLAIAFVWDGFFCFLHLIYAIYFDVINKPQIRRNSYLLIPMRFWSITWIKLTIMLFVYWIASIFIFRYTLLLVHDTLEYLRTMLDFFHLAEQIISYLRWKCYQ